MSAGHRPRGRRRGRGDGEGARRACGQGIVRSKCSRPTAVTPKHSSGTPVQDCSEIYFRWLPPIIRPVLERGSGTTSGSGIASAPRCLGPVVSDVTNSYANHCASGVSPTAASSPLLWCTTFKTTKTDARAQRPIVLLSRFALCLCRALVSSPELRIRPAERAAVLLRLPASLAWRYACP